MGVALIKQPILSPVTAMPYGVGKSRRNFEHPSLGLPPSLAGFPMGFGMAEVRITVPILLSVT